MRLKNKKKTHLGDGLGGRLVHGFRVGVEQSRIQCFCPKINSIKLLIYLLCHKSIISDTAIKTNNVQRSKIKSAPICLLL